MSTPEIKAIIVSPNAESSQRLKESLLKEKIESIEFEDPHRALGYIDRLARDGTDEAIYTIFTDRNMTAMDGFEFAGKVDDIASMRIRKIFFLYILSSVASKVDMAAARNHKSIEYYLIRPLTSESLRSLLKTISRRPA